MSTRALIEIEGMTFAKVYKHYDGYPEATLPWLSDFNKKFTKERGNDPEYKFAQLLRSSYGDAEKYNLDKSTTSGWGVVSGEGNNDVDFMYTLKADGSVTLEDQNN